MTLPNKSNHFQEKEVTLGTKKPTKFKGWFNYFSLLSNSDVIAHGVQKSPQIARLFATNFGRHHALQKRHFGVKSPNMEALRQAMILNKDMRGTPYEAA